MAFGRHNPIYTHVVSLHTGTGARPLTEYAFESVERRLDQVVEIGLAPSALLSREAEIDLHLDARRTWERNPGEGIPDGHLPSLLVLTARVAGRSPKHLTFN